MPKLVLDDIEVNCNSIEDLKEILKKEYHEGQKKLEKIQEEERKLGRRLRKLQALLDGKPSGRKPAAAASL